MHHNHHLQVVGVAVPHCEGSHISTLCQKVKKNCARKNRLLNISWKMMISSFTRHSTSSLYRRIIAPLMSFSTLIKISYVDFAKQQEKKLLKRAKMCKTNLNFRVSMFIMNSFMRSEHEYENMNLLLDRFFDVVWGFVTFIMRSWRFTLFRLFDKFSLLLIHCMSFFSHKSLKIRIKATIGKKSGETVNYVHFSLWISTIFFIHTFSTVWWW